MVGKAHSMKILLAFLCLVFLPRCGPLKELNQTEENSQSAISEKKGKVVEEDENSDSTSKESEEHNNKSKDDKMQNADEGKDNTPPPPQEDAESPTEPQLKEIKLNMNRMLIGGDTNIFEEENVGCAKGELRSADYEKSLDIELKVTEARSEFSLLLGKICGLDYEGAKLEFFDSAGEIPYKLDLEPGQTEFRFPPEGDHIPLEEGIYDLKLTLGEVEERGLFGFVTGYDLDSAVIGDITVSMTETIILFGDFTTE